MLNETSNQHAAPSLGDNTESADRESLRSIVGRLQYHRRAATYHALSGIVGGTPDTVMGDEPHSLRNSWVVDRTTGLPIGYNPEQIHPELRESIEFHGLIDTPAQLSDWLSSRREDSPRDDWERRVLALGTDCGISLPPTSWTSDEMYE